MRTSATATRRRMQREEPEKDPYGVLGKVAAPWVLFVLTFIAAIVLRLILEGAGHTTPAAVMLAVATLIYTYVSQKVSHERKLIGRVHDAVNALAPLSLVTLTVGFGFHWQILLPGFVVGLTTCLAWNRRHTRHSTEVVTKQAGVDASQARAAEWRDLTAEILPELDGSEMVVMKDDKDALVAGLRLGEMQVAGDVAERLERLTRWAGGIRNGGSMVVNEHGDRVLLSFMRSDPLKKVIDWQGPNAPGESMVEPIDGLGVYQNGRDLGFILPHITMPDGNPKILAHMLSHGMAGVGKTEAGQKIDANICTRKESILIYGDAVKADQSVGPIADGAAYVADTLPKIKWLLNRLVHHTVPARAAYLGNPTMNRLGRILTNWEPGCGLSFLTIHIGEGGALFGVGALTTLAERCRSVGIHLHLEIQRASNDRLDTSARYNFGGGLCFGVKDAVDAGMVLSDELLELGVNPSVWQNKKVGYCYLELPGISEKLLTTPARFAKGSPDDVSAAIAEYIHLADPCDPITAASFGDEYAKYRARMDERAGRQPRQYAFAGAPVITGRVAPDPLADVLRTQRAPHEQVPMMTADPLPETRDEDDGTVMPEDEQAEALAEATEEVIEEMSELAEHAADTPEEAEQMTEELRAALADESLGSDLPPFTYNQAADVAFPGAADQDTPPLTREEAIEKVMAIVRRVGVGNTFTPKDIYDAVFAETGRRPSWVRTTLPILMAREVIEQVAGKSKGEYIVLGTDLPADDAA